MTKIEREKAQITKSRMKWAIAADPTSIKRMIKEYYEQLQYHKFNVLEEVD